MFSTEKLPGLAEKKQEDQRLVTLRFPPGDASDGTNGRVSSGGITVSWKITGTKTIPRDDGEPQQPFQSTHLQSFLLTLATT
jgi:hypothetical protein